MDKQISADAKAELVQVLGIRYRKSSKIGKTRILDQFIAVSGYHRKHAIRLLQGETGSDPNPRKSSVKNHGRRIYDEAVKEALIILWEATDRICGKRLRAILPSLIDAMERHGHLNLNSDVRKQLLKVSAATIDRLLCSVHSSSQSKRGRRRSKKVANQVPVRTFADWSLEQFLSQLPRLWKDGEVRPTHRSKSSKPHNWLTREDAFEGVWYEGLDWLQQEPDVTGKNLLKRLQYKYPGRFVNGQCRTLQRRIKEWRKIMARELVYGCIDQLRS